MLGIVCLIATIVYILVAVWRMVTFIASDMRDTWDCDEDYNDTLFGEAIRAGFVHGFFWPALLPGHIMSEVLYRLAYRRAVKTWDSSQVPSETLQPDITGELAKVQEPEPAKKTKAQKALSRQAEKGREEYELKETE